MTETTPRHAEPAAVMPNMLRHEGVWTGTYTHLDPGGKIIDTHHARVKCEFPNSGPYFYIQHNHFTWDDGREQDAVLPAIFRDGKLWWDTDTFHGYAWESEDIILLNLTRKDEPGAYFVEVIVMGETTRHRTRTWHWFRDGRLYRRTLCDETKAD